jgi:hypothetical protein
MKKIALLLALFLAFASPAQAKRLAAITITTAVTAQTTTPLQVGRGPLVGMSIQIRFVYGSGGTTVAAWVQTSLDGGATWADVAAPAAITTASLTSVFNVSAQTPALTPITITDGALAAGTAKDGMLGPLWRVKYTTTGTYAGSTQLLVDINGAQLTP